MKRPVVCRVQSRPSNKSQKIQTLNVCRVLNNLDQSQNKLHPDDFQCYMDCSLGKSPMARWGRSLPLSFSFNWPWKTFIFAVVVYCGTTFAISSRTAGSLDSLIFLFITIQQQQHWIHHNKKRIPFYLLSLLYISSNQLPPSCGQLLQLGKAISHEIDYTPI